MRILHIIPYYPPAWDFGGPVKVAEALCEGLAARGHNVTVLTTDALNARQRATPRHEILNGVDVIRLPNLSNALAWRRIFVPSGMRRALSAALPATDIVHLHEARTLMHLAALPMLRRTRTPFVLTAHGSLPHHAQKGLVKTVYDILGGRAALDEACRLHAISEVEAMQYTEARLDPARIVTIPNGIHAPEYHDLPSGDAFRQRLGIAADAPLVLFLARLHPIKSVDFLIEAFALLRQQIPQAQLAIVGPDDGAEQAARKQIAAAGLQDAAHFIGFISGKEKLSAYRAADAYVLPSRFDIFSISLVEAMACGAPVTVSRGCSLAVEVERYGLGATVDYGDVFALAKSLYATLTNLHTARAIAEKGREWALKTFDWENIVTDMEKLYAACLEQR